MQISGSWFLKIFDTVQFWTPWEFWTQNRSDANRSFHLKYRYDDVLLNVLTPHCTPAHVTRLFGADRRPSSMNMYINKTFCLGWAFDDTPIIPGLYKRIVNYHCVVFHIHLYILFVPSFILQFFFNCVILIHSLWVLLFLLYIVDAVHKDVDVMEVKIRLTMILQAKK